MEAFYANLPYMGPGNQQQTAAPAPTPQPAQNGWGGTGVAAPTYAPAGAPQPPDPALADTDPQEWKRQYDAYHEAKLEAALARAAPQFLQPVYQQNAGSAREQSKAGRWSQVWQRYPHEIDRLMANVPFNQRTKDAYDSAAKMVFADHAQEFMQQQSGTPAQPQNGSVSTSDAGSAPPQPENSPLDRVWDTPHIRQLRDAGFNKTQIRQRIAAMNQTEEQYVAAIERGNVIFSTANQGAGRRGSRIATNQTAGQGVGVGNE